MLGKPEVGWTKVTIGEFEQDASYTTCVPMDCLEACLHRVKERGPLAFTFDAEGPGRFFVTSTSSDTIISWEYWEDPDDSCIRIVGVNDVRLVLEIVHDIELYMDDWCNEWDFSFTKEELTHKLEELKFLLPEWYPLRNISHNL